MNTATTQAFEPTRWLTVGERRIQTDSEGYLIDRSQWSEEFVRALAAQE
ncbi:MAG: TusE/DsrC/DsvC family sulfur relay protein, partial [Casimicrobiaceae bacterium]